jgi:hypothetical protein
MCERNCKNCELTRFRRPVGGWHDAPTVICAHKLDFPDFSPAPIDECDNVDEFTPKDPGSTKASPPDLK